MSRLQTFCGDQNGSAVVEFAMIAPVLLMTLAGVLDMGYNYYAQAQLQGAVQRVARLSTVEGAEFRHEDLDMAVRNAVHQIVPDAELDISRSSYANFSDIAQPEDFTDVDNDGSCNDGEPFEDANGNGVWDEDRGSAGFGSARDAVLYVVNVTYPRAFGAGGLIGLPDVATSASTVLRNQPFGEQAERSGVGHCA